MFSSNVSRGDKSTNIQLFQRIDNSAKSMKIQLSRIYLQYPVGKAQLENVFRSIYYHNVCIFGEIRFAVSQNIEKIPAKRCLLKKFSK